MKGVTCAEANGWVPAEPRVGRPARSPPSLLGFRVFQEEERQGWRGLPTLQPSPAPECSLRFRGEGLAKLRLRFRERREPPLTPHRRRPAEQPPSSGASVSWEAAHLVFTRKQRTCQRCALQCVPADGSAWPGLGLAARPAHSRRDLRERGGEIAAALATPGASGVAERCSARRGARCLPLCGGGNAP